LAGVVAALFFSFFPETEAFREGSFLDAIFLFLHCGIERGPLPFTLPCPITLFQRNSTAGARKKPAAHLDEAMQAKQSGAVK
jgi:hypothetical protein